MKGHMQDGKFHPHTQSKGVRKSRDQKAKQQGVSIRNKRYAKDKEIRDFLEGRGILNTDAPLEQHHIDYFNELEKLNEEERRKARELPRAVVQGVIDDLGGTDVEVDHYNPKWKLYEVYVDGDRYYMFPDEESAIAFGRQSIRDTATDYIPDKGTEHYDEYKNLDEDELVEKIIEEQSEYGQLSELGALAKSVAGYDGQYHQLPDGWIAFQID